MSFTSRKLMIGNNNSSYTWNTMTFPVGFNPGSLAYGGGRFVALPSGTRAAYSDDGISWVAATNTIANTQWYASTYGANRFVSLSIGGTATYSNDGATWTSASIASRPWQSVVYGGVRFVAVASDNASSGAYSSNGTSWTTFTLPGLVSQVPGLTAQYRAVAYGNGRFVAIGGTTTSSSYSNDGITWLSGSGLAYYSWSRVAYGNGIFVAITDNPGGVNANVCAYSNDGITWTMATLPDSDINNNSWIDIIFDGSSFFVFGGSTLIKSINGVNWNFSQSPPLQIGRAVYGEGRIVGSSTSNQGAYTI